MVAALSGGEIRKEICRQICRSDFYYKKTMYKMKKDGESETVFRKPRTLHIKYNGVEKVADQIPGLTERCLNKQLRIFTQQESQRRADISQVIYNMQLAGLKIYPKEKKDLYADGDLSGEVGAFYAPSEITEKSELFRASRMCGLVVAKNTLYSTYQMCDRNIRFMKKTEQVTDVFLKSHMKDSGRIVFADDREKSIHDIIQNGELERSKGGMAEYNRLTLDDSFFFVENGTSGAIALRLLQNADLVSGLRQKIMEKEGKTVINGMPLSTMAIRLMEVRKDAIIMCTDADEAFFRSFDSSGHEYYVFKEKELEKILYSCG